MFSDSRGPQFTAVDKLTGGRLSRLLDEESFKAKPGKTLLVHTDDLPFKRCLLVGLGKSEELVAQGLRDLAAHAVNEANKRKLKGAFVMLPASIEGSDAIRFGTEGAALAGYRYDKWLTQDVEPLTCDAVTLIHAKAKGLDPVVVRAARASEGVALARDLVNEPPATMYPGVLAKVAAQVAKEEGLECKILKKGDIVKAGMNLLLAVSAGSERPPRLIHLTYRPPGATAKTKQIALVGKGLTYDAGGYNIKPTGSLEDMKIDMAGGAAVIGAMKAVAAFAPDCIVHGIVPSSENLISGEAYKPGDVIKSYNGKTVEIMNTDAEGRLILADALAYVAKLKVDRIVDLATLTGACMVALGPHTAALFGNNDAFRDRVFDAAKRSGEDVWPMPLSKKLRGMLDSPIADMKNIGQRWGGAITAALFLHEFVGKTTWAHLDIAGPSFSEKAEPSVPRGGTGFAVRLLLELVANEV